MLGSTRGAVQSNQISQCETMPVCAGCAGSQMVVWQQAAPTCSGSVGISWPLGVWAGMCSEQVFSYRHISHAGMCYQMDHRSDIFLSELGRRMRWKREGGEETNQRKQYFLSIIFDAILSLSFITLISQIKLILWPLSKLLAVQSERALGQLLRVCVCNYAFESIFPSAEITFFLCYHTLLLSRFSSPMALQAERPHCVPPPPPDLCN